jgi:hypothetical protein
VGTCGIHASVLILQNLRRVAHYVSWAVKPPGRPKPNRQEFLLLFFKKKAFFPLFFFEKKNQKTFDSLILGAGKYGRAQRAELIIVPSMHAVLRG